MSSDELATESMGSMNLAASEDDSCLEEDLSLIFDDGTELPGARTMRSSQKTLTEMKKINGILEKGLSKAAEHITLRRVVDFPYRDACPDGCKCGGKTHLNLQKGILERAWVFQVDDENQRFVVHGHTFNKWEDRERIPPNARADKLTSLNIRTACRQPAGWQSDQYGEVVIPKHNDLRKDWKSTLKKSLSDSKSADAEAATWNWRYSNHIPTKDRTDKSALETYKQMRTLLQIAEGHDLHANLAEAYSKKQTHRLFRSHVPGVAKSDLHPVGDFDVFIPVPAPGRRPVRYDEPAPASPASSQSAGTSGWDGLHVAALCIGCSQYDWMPKLPNAKNDAEALHGKLDSLELCKAQLLLDVKDRKHMKKGIKEFLQQLQASPPDVVTITYAGHGGVLKSGKACLIPCNVDPEDEDEDEINLGISTEDILALCREFLDETARDRNKVVTFFLLLDCCRVSIKAFDRTLLSSSLEGVSNKSPTRYVVHFSCRLDTEASDGPAGANSPFVQALLDENKGIFKCGLPLLKGLELADNFMQDKTPQAPVQFKGGPVDGGLCLYETSDNGRDTPSSNSASRDDADDRSSTLDYLRLEWKSYNESKTELASGIQIFDGETVRFARERGLRETSKSQNVAKSLGDVPFYFDKFVSKDQMLLESINKIYHLKNLQPTCGTWLKLEQVKLLAPGMIFKVGIDEVGDSKLPGFNMYTAYKSCFKVISTQQRRVELEREPITADLKDKRAKVSSIKRTTLYHRTTESDSQIKGLADFEHTPDFEQLG